MANKIDSNVTGLRIAEETAVIGVLPGTPDWLPMEPNSYSDFGGQGSVVSRNTINDTRQRDKGVLVDFDASGGFNIDVSQDRNVIDVLQGFFQADIAEKGTTKERNAAQLPITSVDATTDEYRASGSGLDGINLIVEHLVFAEGFDDASNNGLKIVASVAAGAIGVDEALIDDASPSATAAFLTTVGYQFASATCDVVVPGGEFPYLDRVSGAVDWTTIGLNSGDWIFIGGDGAATIFDTAANNGWARVKTVAAARITVDKTDSTWVAEVGADETIQIFFGHRINNATIAGNINRRSYNVERTLGDNGTGVQSEYMTGAVPGEMTVNISQAEKITMDLSFIGIDHETRDGATGVKAGNRPTLGANKAFNSTNHVKRARIGIVSTTVSNVTDLFAFFTELTFSLNNNISPNKAVTQLVAFDVSSGNFDIGGEMTAYFSDIAALAAIRSNSDITIDFAMVRDNAGLLFDIPLLAIGDGRADVELDAPITLPLGLSAGKDPNLLYTSSVSEFVYLPDAAE